MVSNSLSTGTGHFGMARVSAKMVVESESSGRCERTASYSSAGSVSNDIPIQLVVYCVFNITRVARYLKGILTLMYERFSSPQLDDKLR